jgi:hypothetical protein
VGAGELKGRKNPQNKNPNPNKSRKIKEQRRERGEIGVWCV